MVQSSRAINKSEVLMTTTLSQYTSRVFGSVSLPNQKEFNRQNKINGHRIFMINQNLKILLFCTVQDYNQAISRVILSQIFDTARNAYCTQITRVVFFYGSESWYRPRRDRKL